MPDGMLVFVDRKKNIIRRAGENIAAPEVEAVLQAYDISVAPWLVMATALRRGRARATTQRSRMARAAAG